MLYSVFPKIPYEKKVKFEIRPGFQLIVTGNIHHAYHAGKPASSVKGFQINLTGEHRFDGSRILHFNPRFERNTVVLNTNTGSWGPEQVQNNYPFHNDHDFIIVIQAHPDEFKIFVNGHHFTDYKHRQPLNHITGISITGLVTLHQVIATQNEGHALSHPAAFSPSNVIANHEFPKFHDKPAIPAEFHIPGNLHPGMVFAISGKPDDSAQRFHINWMTHNGNVAFHLNPRFESPTVVRNTCIGGNWGQEEREHSSPFHRDHKFYIFVKVHPGHYEVWVNGVHFCDYHHRVLPAEEVTSIKIDGDVKIKHVAIGF